MVDPPPPSHTAHTAYGRTIEARARPLTGRGRAQFRLQVTSSGDTQSKQVPGRRHQHRRCILLFNVYIRDSRTSVFFYIIQMPYASARVLSLHNLDSYALYIRCTLIAPYVYLLLATQGHRVCVGVSYPAHRFFKKQTIFFTLKYCSEPN